jgi:hypothetical protein
VCGVVDTLSSNVVVAALNVISHSCGTGRLSEKQAAID